MVRKIDFEDCSHLDHGVASLLTLKINVDDHCYSFNRLYDNITMLMAAIVNKSHLNKQATSNFFPVTSSLFTYFNCINCISSEEIEKEKKKEN